MSEDFPFAHLKNIADSVTTKDDLFSIQFKDDAIMIETKGKGWKRFMGLMGLMVGNALKALAEQENQDTEEVVE